jgi:hypothetical protein
LFAGAGEVRGGGESEYGHGQSTFFEQGKDVVPGPAEVFVRRVLARVVFRLEGEERGKRLERRQGEDRAEQVGRLAGSGEQLRRTRQELERQELEGQELKLSRA